MSLKKLKYVLEKYEIAYWNNNGAGRLIQTLA